MDTIIATRLAGPGAHLVARPHGVPHVYVGPLSPRGSVPRRCRVVCSARTRRLSVLTLDRRSGTRVCARCAACLNGRRRQVAHPLRTRGDYLAQFTGLTGHQLAAALEHAATPAEVDQVGHLTLLLFGHTGCRQPDPATGKSLHQLVAAARARFQTQTTFTGFDEARELAEHRRRADRQAAHEEREARIARLGIRNATAQ